MIGHHRKHLTITLAGFTASVLLLTACGSTDAGTPEGAKDSSSRGNSFPAVTVDLGGGKTVKYPASSQMRIAFFDFGSGFTYTAAMLKGAQKRADELGIKMDHFDPQVDPQKQVTQMQDAISSGKYVGGWTEPIASGLLCDLATKTAPANNFMFVDTHGPVCGREQNEGEDLWAPGSLAFISANQEISTLSAWVEYIQQHNPGPQKVIGLMGPQTAAQVQNLSAALKSVQSKHPDFQVVDTVYTDFTQQDAVTKMQDALQAHPDATVVATLYSELTAGTTTVLKQQGKNDVKVYDIGAASTVLPLIQSGDVQMTTPYYPETLGATAVQALYDARMGKPVQRFYPNSGLKAPAMQGSDKLLFLTKDNLAEFQSAGLSEY